MAMPPDTVEHTNIEVTVDPWLCERGPSYCAKKLRMLSGVFGIVLIAELIRCSTFIMTVFVSIDRDLEELPPHYIPYLWGVLLVFMFGAGHRVEKEPSRRLYLSLSRLCEAAVVLFYCLARWKNGGRTVGIQEYFQMPTYWTGTYLACGFLLLYVRSVVQELQFNWMLLQVHLAIGGWALSISSLALCVFFNWKNLEIQFPSIFFYGMISAVWLVLYIVSLAEFSWLLLKARQRLTKN